MNIASYIDHTILKPATVIDDIRKLCSEASDYGFAAVCVPPPFVKSAKKILNERGLPTDSDSISRLREEKMKDTAKPESSQILHIMGGYILALLGGVAGIVIGFLMWNSQRQMPNGITVFSYSEVERRHGRIIFGLGILIFVIVLSIRLRQIPV